jgi:hypothetical protein
MAIWPYSYLLIFFILAVPVKAPCDDSGPFLVERITTVIHSSSIDQASNSVLLHGDLELLARLLLVSRHGSDWKTASVDSSLLFKTRRMAILGIMLANIAINIGEKADPSRRKKLFMKFEEQAGGADSFEKLLGECFSSRESVLHWCTIFLLAGTQLRYMRDQVSILSDYELKEIFETGNHKFTGASFEEAKEAYKIFVIDKEMRKLFDQWLSSMMLRVSLIFPQ